MSQNLNTVRLDILLNLKELFENTTEANDGLKFSHVNLGPLTEGAHARRVSIGIVAGKETKDAVSRARNCHLPVDIEFRITVNQGDPDAAVLGERVLGVVQQVINKNPDLNGLVIDMTETGNELSLDVYNDRTVEGVVNLTVEYRHSERDVRDPTLSV